MESNQVLKGVIESLPAKTGSGYAGGQEGDLIQLYANDGTPNGKISRDALMSCVKDSLGTLLNQGAADLGTSLAKIPALNSGGTLGSATVANLASVLGGQGSVQAATDLNADTITRSGMWQGSSFTNTPQTTGVLIVPFYRDGYWKYQIFASIYDGRVWMRNGTSSSYTPWAEVAFDYPSFYKNYADLVALSTALGVPKIFLISSNANANSYNYECRVLCNTQGLSSATNFPPSATYGILEAKSWSNSRITQEYRGLENPLYHYFRKTDDGGEHWSAWVQLQD